MKKGILLFTTLLSAPNMFAFGISYFDLKSKIVSLYKSIKNQFYEETIDLEQFRVFSDITFDDVIGMEAEVNNARQYIQRVLADSNVHTERYLCLGTTRTGKSYFVNSFIGSMQQTIKERGLKQNTVIALDCSIGCDSPQYTNTLNKIRTILHEKPDQIFVIYSGEMEFHDGAIPQCQEIITRLLKKLFVIQKEFPSARIITFLMAAKENITDQMRTIGNFTKTIKFDYPLYEQKKEFFHRNFKKLGIDENKFDLDLLIQKIDAFLHTQSYEKLEYLLHVAMMKATTQNVSFNQEFFENYLDREITCVKKKIRDLIFINHLNPTSIAVTKKFC
jgi:hypothetical protein